MYRLRTIALLVVLVATALGVQTASASEVDREACGGGVLISTGDKLYLTSGPASTSFLMNWNGGLPCPWMGGTLTGSTCTSWTGSGGSPFGRFSITGAGTTLVFTGAIEGTVELNYESIPCNFGSKAFKGLAALTYVTN